ncbi:hypothetical protein Q1M63_00600 (plasmid) [Sinorhizobium meliloti]|nr:hypothetical protein LZK74_00535 [Sinorhizobium meliloti]WKL24223.1 hypothetical protein Q1M63_00600 [Sinorhizobium meliloti]WKL28184.1 hypothetical protein Q1M65_00525 [Sinorhizobium meliloti]WKL33748.1 hypothetical protein Q1M62_00525 [Sinorhizobium meliloti]
MNLWRIGLAWCLIVVSTCFATSQDLDAYLDPSGRMRDRLVLEDSQSGFAGVTTDIWTIETNGTFTIERLLDGKPIASARTGTLAPEDLKSIVAVLATQDIRSFPAEAGAADKINARSLKLIFGEQTSVLWLPAGESVTRLACSDKAPGNSRGPAKVAAAIVRAVGTLDKEQAPFSGNDGCE